MSRLARLEGNEGIKRHKTTVMVSLKDADISMRRRALDLLFVISDHENAAGIVEELMTYLAVSDAAMREEMVLKIAILAEKFSTDPRWYVDTVLQVRTQCSVLCIYRCVDTLAVCLHACGHVECLHCSTYNVRAVPLLSLHLHYEE
jgi:Adaptin N terminal region